MSLRRLINSLNALGVGELEIVLQRLDEARSAVRDREDLAEVAAYLEEARDALLDADLRTYRKRIQRSVASLGHAAED